MKSRPALALLVALVAGTLLTLSWGPAIGRTWDRLVHPDRSRLPAFTGHFGFLLTQDGSSVPVSWSPCEPIHYVVNPVGGPRNWQDIVEAAEAQVEAASGFDLVFDGVTADRDFAGRRESVGYQPVLIGWATDDQVPTFDTDAIGVAVSWPPRNAGFKHYVTGIIALDRDYFATLDGERQFQLQRSTIMHEWGHVLGLDHVDDPNEVMNEYASVHEWGPGDLVGLHQLGKTAC